MSVGLDIGTKTIKIVELDGTPGNWHLRASGVVGYSGDSVESLVDDAKMAALAQAIKNLHREARILSKDIYLSFPEQKVFVSILKFPTLTDSEIASAVKWEAEQNIPMPVDDAVIQHQILERRESATPPEVSVLLIAVPKSVVEKYVQIVQMAGLNVTAVETALMAEVRSLAPKDKTAVVVDIGSSSTAIGISKAGQLYFSRSVPVSGEAFTRAIAKALGVDTRQAEEYKRTYGLVKDKLEGKISQALIPMLDILVDEVNKAIQFYESEGSTESPSELILAGGSAATPGLTSYLTSKLDKEVVLGNPFQSVSLDSQAQKTLAGYSPIYSVAVGLAMRKG